MGPYRTAADVDPYADVFDDTDIRFRVSKAVAQHYDRTGDYPRRVVLGTNAYRCLLIELQGRRCAQIVEGNTDPGWPLKLYGRVPVEPAVYLWPNEVACDG